MENKLSFLSLSTSNLNIKCCGQSVCAIYFGVKISKGNPYALLQGTFIDTFLSAYPLWSHDLRTAIRKK